MDTEASAVDHPDPTIIDFVENSGLVPPGKYTRFERLPGGVSSDIWLVHADDRQLLPSFDRANSVLYVRFIGG
jgi:hypothetical protein